MTIPREVWISHENNVLNISYENDGLCRVVAVVPITLSGVQIVDGVTLGNGDIVLATNQASLILNGMYVVNTSGLWTQLTVATVANWIALSPFTPVTVKASAGTVYANTFWSLTAPGTYVQVTELVRAETYCQNLNVNWKYETKKSGQPGATSKDTNVIPDNPTIQVTAFYEKKANQWTPYIDYKKKYKFEFGFLNQQYSGTAPNENDDHVFRYCRITDQKIAMSDDKVVEVVLTLEAEYEE